jgi:DNA helicase IV
MAKKSQIKLELEAIIIDEGQDFAHQEINNLSQLIPDNGTFYIFQDSNQNVSNKTKRFALEVNPNVLDKNCRNTDKIFKYAEPFVSCTHPRKSSSIVGRDVVQRLYKERYELFNMLEEDVLNLVNNEKIYPAQIVILTDMYPLNKSIFSSYSHINRFYLKQYSFSNRDKNTIQWSNIGMYKGLESDIIFLVFEKTKTLIPNNWDIANKYVGATRAKSLLVIYDSPDPEIDF